MKTPLKKPSLGRQALERLHGVQKGAGRFFKRPTSGMRTELTANGKPVIFIHNPRAGGRSLEAFFNVERLSHAFPVDRLNEKHWLENFVVTSVRHPLERFFSGYFSFVMTPVKNSLVKLYGWGIKELDALEYLDLIKKHPSHIGPQVQWSDFPSVTKPRADLVLRFENIAKWSEDIAAAGVDIQGRTIPHIGKSGNKKEVEPADVRLDARGFTILKDRVFDHLRADFEAFGYTMP